MFAYYGIPSVTLTRFSEHLKHLAPYHNGMDTMKIVSETVLQKDAAAAASLTEHLISHWNDLPKISVPTPIAAALRQYMEF